jgi:curved DNA-binding protein CbpA
VPGRALILPPPPSPEPRSPPAEERLPAKVRAAEPMAPAHSPSPAAPAAGPVFFAEAEMRAGSLEQLDYFQLFQLPIAATPREIKEAYYRESRLYHPDRFGPLPDPELKERLTAIYKRITEAYVVLRDDKKRAKYLADLAGPEREKKLRYTEASEVEQKAESKKALEEQVGTTPKGRECFKNGLKEQEARRYEAALRQFKMASMYEPSNARYKEKVKESEVLWEKNRPKEDFRIK